MRTSRSTFQLVSCFAVFALLAPIAGCRSISETFEPPEPELLYSGSAPGLQAGVLVIDDPEDLERAVAPLDPDFAGAIPDLSDLSVLRIVGRGRANGCRDTKLKRVATSGRTAQVHLEELVPETGCPCGSTALPPRAWLVTVTGWVTRADRQITDVVVSCDEARESAAETAGADRVVQILESSWREGPGSRILGDGAEYRRVVGQLGVADRAEPVDFEQHRVVVVTGRARENGCRRTRVLTAQLASPEEAVFTLEEAYAAPGQACSQIFQPAKVFLYRVPATVTRSRIVTKERRERGES